MLIPVMENTKAGKWVYSLSVIVGVAALLWLVVNSDTRRSRNHPNIGTLDVNAEYQIRPSEAHLAIRSFR